MTIGEILAIMTGIALDRDVSTYAIAKNATLIIGNTVRM
jgi:hypothetical protein